MHSRWRRDAQSTRSDARLAPVGGRVRYTKPKAGEWVQPVRKGYRLACCDCCLVHTMDFRVVKYGKGKSKIQFRVFRHNRATAAMRRGRIRLKTVKK